MPPVRSRRRRTGGTGNPVPAARRARSDWDRAIDVWEDFEESGKDYAREFVHGPALLRAIGPLRGRKVLDLGCGQGRFTRRLARRGARVAGVDWSGRMIESAQRHEGERPLGIEFRVLDARRSGRAWPAGSFDRVVACMSLMDMPDLSRVLRAVHRLLRPGGRFVFSVSHPLNTAEVGWERAERRGSRGMVIDRYFDHRVGVTRWEMERLKRPFSTVYWHRPLESWFSLLRSSGFEVEALTEPHATADQAARLPLLSATGRVPFFLVLSCRKRRAEPSRRVKTR